MPSKPDIASKYYRMEAFDVPPYVIETSRKITELMRDTFESSNIKLKGSPAASTVEDEITFSPHFFDGFIMARFLPRKSYAALTVEDFNGNFNLDLFKVNLAIRLETDKLSHFLLVPTPCRKSANGLYRPDHSPIRK